MTSKSCGVLAGTSRTEEERSDFKIVNAPRQVAKNAVLLPLWVMLTQLLIAGNFAPEVLTKVLGHLDVSSPVLLLPEATKTGDSGQAMLLGHVISEQLAEKMKQVLLAIPEKADALLQLFEKFETNKKEETKEEEEAKEETRQKSATSIASDESWEVISRSEIEIEEPEVEATIVKKTGFFAKVKNIFKRKEKEPKAPKTKRAGFLKRYFGKKTTEEQVEDEETIVAEVVDRLVSDVVVNEYLQTPVESSADDVAIATTSKDATDTEKAAEKEADDEDEGDTYSIKDIDEVLAQYEYTE